MMASNGKLLLQGSIFRCYVSFREGTISFRGQKRLISDGPLAGESFFQGGVNEMRGETTSDAITRWWQLKFF